MENIQAFFIKVLITILILIAYNKVPKKSFKNFSEEIKDKNKFDIKIKTILFILCSIILLTVNYFYNRTIKIFYLIYYIVLFRYMYDIFLFLMRPLVRRNAAKKFKTNEKFQYFDEVIMSNGYAIVACGLIFNIFAYKIEFVKSIEDIIGGMLFATFFINFFLYSTRLSLEDQNISMKDKSFVDKIYFCFYEFLKLIKVWPILIMFVIFIISYIFIIR